MIITEPTLIDSINVTVKRSIKIAGFGEGEDYEAYITPALKIDIPGLISHNVAAAVLKKDHFGLSNYAGMPIHGLLGYDFFSNLSVRLSFADSTIQVSQPRDMRIFRNAVRIPLVIEENKPYIKTKITYANGTQKTVKLIVDLGAGHALSLENEPDKNILQKKFINANLGLGLNGLISGSVSRIKEVDIGKYKIKNVITSFPDDNTRHLSIPRDGNIGVELLKKFNIIFDYYNSAMYLKPSVYYRSSFEHDMSGLGYYADGENYSHIVIDRIEAGSAGEDAGLKQGDEIVAINFKPVANMNLQQIDELFKSKDGRAILLDIYRDKNYSHVILTLKRRI